MDNKTRRFDNAVGDLIEERDGLKIELEEWKRRSVHLVADREKLLWLACTLLQSPEVAIARYRGRFRDAVRILDEYGYDEERIAHVASKCEPDAE